MSRTLWRVRPRGERPTTVAKPKENLIANCPLLNHYLGARWPSTTCRRISVLSLPQTAHSRLAVACARCFPPPCQGGPSGLQVSADSCRPWAGCDPHSPTGAVLWGAAAAIDSHLRARRGAGWPRADGPCASRSGAANLHRRGEHPQAARRRRRGQGFHIHRLRHTAAVRWLGARHRNRPTRPRRVDVQRMPRWRAAPLRQLHRSGRHALNDRRIACRRCGVSVWRRDVGCRPGLFDL